MYKQGNKGIINFIEAIFVIVALFVAFAVLFPGYSFKTRWPDATNLLSARDLILTMDRLNLLYSNSFNSSYLQNFVDTVFPVNRTGLVAFASIDGTVQNSIVVACNCSDVQIQNLTYWMSGMKINGRNINISFVPTTLHSINPSDVLLVWGDTRTNLDYSPVNDSLYNYLKTGAGIVEVMDLYISQTPSGGVQQNIFGVTYQGIKNYNNKAQSDYFSRKPFNASDIDYGPYKYFFHVPVPLKTYQLSSSIPVEQGMTQTSCASTSGLGNFILNQTVYKFWICNSTTVYFDTDNNSSADRILRSGDNFKILGYNFTLQYINFPSQIGVVFGLNYQFQDFLINMTNPGSSCPPGNAWGHYYTGQVAPVNNEPRILINASFPVDRLADLPVVILNNSGGRTAWMSDFTNDPNFNNNCLTFSSAGDDEKLLLASLLLWASKKQQFQIVPTNVKTGLLTSYVNVQNLDTYEVYKFNLGFSSPFGS